MNELPPNQPLSHGEIQCLIHCKSLDALQDIDRLIRRHERAQEQTFRRKRYLWRIKIPGRGRWIDWLHSLCKPGHRRPGSTKRS